MCGTNAIEPLNAGCCRVIKARRHFRPDNNVKRLYLPTLNWSVHVELMPFFLIRGMRVLYWRNAAETTTDRRHVGGGHTASGHDPVTGVLAVGFTARLVTVHALIKEAPRRGTWRGGLRRRHLSNCSRAGLGGPAPLVIAGERRDERLEHTPR